MSRNASKSSRKSSRKSSGKTVPKVDRRVLRTRDVLGDALVELMHEKPFKDITVQHVLDRAGVSRSTFYTHYRDKEDLFLSDVEDFLEMMAFVLSRRNEASNRVAPVRELFAHIAEWHKFQVVLVAADKFRDFLELAQGYFARAIEQRLNEIDSAHGKQGRAESHTVSAQMFAGSLLSLLEWWIARGMPGSPEEMDHRYHQMVWSGVTATARKASL